MLRKEGPPVVVQESAVGLQRVVHHLLWATQLLGELDRATKERKASQGGLAALPRHFHRAVRLRRKEIRQVDPEAFLRHPLRVVIVQKLLRQEEAVGAVQIAGRAGRLD